MINQGGTSIAKNLDQHAYTISIAGILRINEAFSYGTPRETQNVFTSNIMILNGDYCCS